MKSFLPAATVMIGLLLLIVSLAWGLVAPAGAGWTQEKSQRLQELRRQAHILGSQAAGANEKPTMHGGKNAAEIQAEYEQVKAELETLGDEAEGKIKGPQTTAAYLRWIGIACTLVGVVAFYAVREA
jgi:hypothetical protein